MNPFDYHHTPNWYGGGYRVPAYNDEKWGVPTFLQHKYANTLQYI
jgi:hypothetical protein